jgi:hypothetical protein
VCNTNKIPDNASRSGSRRRPGYLDRRRFTGKSGSTSPHNSSDTTHGASTDIDTPPSLTTDADGIRRQKTGPFILQSVLSANENEKCEVIAGTGPADTCATVNMNEERHFVSQSVAARCANDRPARRELTRRKHSRLTDLEDGRDDFRIGRGAEG